MSDNDPTTPAEQDFEKLIEPEPWIKPPLTDAELDAIFLPQPEKPNETDNPHPAVCPRAVYPR